MEFGTMLDCCKCKPDKRVLIFHVEEVVDEFGDVYFRAEGYCGNCQGAIWIGPDRGIYSRAERDGEAFMDFGGEQA